MLNDISEAQVEERLRKAIIKRKGLCLKFISPSFAGAPDRIILLPWCRIYFAELKRPKGGRTSAVQKTVHAVFAALGFPVHLLLTYEEVDNFLIFIDL